MANHAEFSHQTCRLLGPSLSTNPCLRMQVCFLRCQMYGWKAWSFIWFIERASLAIVTSRECTVKRVECAVPRLWFIKYGISISDIFVSLVVISLKCQESVYNSFMISSRVLNGANSALISAFYYEEAVDRLNGFAVTTTPVPPTSVRLCTLWTCRLLYSAVFDEFRFDLFAEISLVLCIGLKFYEFHGCSGSSRSHTYKLQGLISGDKLYKSFKYGTLYFSKGGNTKRFEAC